MLFKNKYKNKNEPILEPIFRILRFGVAYDDLKEILKKESIILDYGCGPEAKFFSYLVSNKFDFKKYYGYDLLIKKNIESKKIILTSDYKNIRVKKFNLVTLFAVLEHLPFPNFDFSFFVNRLKNGGYLLITTPTKSAKPVLEFLSFRLGLVSKREIEEHKHYYDLREIENLFSKYSLKIINKKVFEFGFNNYILFRKT